MTRDDREIWKLVESKNPLGVVYHFTELNNALSIVKENTFKLTFSYSENELIQGKRGKSFYLSTTRSPMGEYSYPPSSPSVMFVLDAGKIAQKYQIKPYDYWNSGFIKNSAKKFGKNEMEDRIYSFESTMESKPYIKEIRIFYVPPDNETIDKDINKAETHFNTIRKIRELNAEFPVKVFSDSASFVYGRGKEVTRNFVKPDHYNERLQEMIDWLSQDAPKYDYRFFGADTMNSLTVDIHNIRKNPSESSRKVLQQLQNLIRKNKVSSLSELYNKKKQQAKEAYLRGGG